MRKPQQTHTPNLDRMIEVKDEAEVVQGFLDWLLDNDDLEARLYVEPGHNPLGMSVIASPRSREMLMGLYFGVDPREAEAERMSVLLDLQADHKVRAAIERKAAQHG